MIVALDLFIEPEFTNQQLTDLVVNHSRTTVRINGEIHQPSDSRYHRRNHETLRRVVQVLARHKLGVENNCNALADILQRLKTRNRGSRALRDMFGVGDDNSANFVAMFKEVPYVTINDQVLPVASLRILVADGENSVEASQELLQQIVAGFQERADASSLAPNQLSARKSSFNPLLTFAIGIAVIVSAVLVTMLTSSKNTAQAHQLSSHTGQINLTQLNETQIKDVVRADSIDAENLLQLADWAISNPGEDTSELLIACLTIREFAYRTMHLHPYDEHRRLKRLSAFGLHKAMPNMLNLAKDRERPATLREHAIKSCEAILRCGGGNAYSSLVGDFAKCLTSDSPSVIRFAARSLNYLAPYQDVQSQTRLFEASSTRKPDSDPADLALGECYFALAACERIDGTVKARFEETLSSVIRQIDLSRPKYTGLAAAAIFNSCEEFTPSPEATAMITELTKTTVLTEKAVRDSWLSVRQ